MKFGIVFGANSYEHEISIVSAIVIKKALKADLKFIFLDQDRNSYLIDPKDMRANFFSTREYKRCKKLHLIHGGFATHGLFGVRMLDVDCYINLIHGCDGEDGKIAAMFDFYSIKYIGPRLEASVMSFNKILTKILAKKCGVEVLDYAVIKRGDEVKISYPFILKPARLGSSIGINVVKEAKELEYLLDKSFEFDNEILVEPFIEGVREFNLAGTKINDEFVFSMIEEPKKNEFLDFEQKYMSFNQRTANEAEISQELKALIKTAFEKIYDGGCFYGAIIRCDFFVIDGIVYLNEINPNPGSMANYLFEDFSNVVTNLALSIEPSKKISIDYEFINSITSNKGKAI